MSNTSAQSQRIVSSQFFLLKKHFTITLLLLLALVSIETRAQNNLQFNRAKFISLSCACSLKDTIITVPPNTVWKIERAAVNIFSNMYFELDGAVIYTNVAAYGDLNVFPIWLPAGSYTIQLYQSTGYSAVKGFISAIEFNLVE